MPASDSAGAGIPMKKWTALWRILRDRLNSLVRFRWMFLLPGIASIAYGQVLIEQRYPKGEPLPQTELWNALYKLHIVNFDNVLRALPFFLGGAFLCALTVLPLAWKTSTANINFSLRERINWKEQLPLHLIGGTLLIFLVIQLARHIYHPAYPILWLLSIFVFTFTAWKRDRMEKRDFSPGITALDLFWIASLLLLGFIINSYALADIPATLVPDEGSFWENARVVAIHELKPAFFDSGVYSFPMASTIYQGWILRIFGVNLWGWRFSSVIAGVITVIPLYLLGTDWFNRQTGIAAAVLLVSNPYFISFARLGYNNSQSLFPVTLCIYFFTLAVRKESVLYLWLAGIAAGMGFYTYSAAWLGPVTLCLGVLYLFITRQAKWKQALISLGIILLALGIMFAPRIAYGASAEGTNSLAYKLFETSFVNTYYARTLYGESDLLQTMPFIHFGYNDTIFYNPVIYRELLFRGTIRTLTSLFDPHIVREHFLVTGFAGAPIFSILFLVGLVLSLRRWKELRFGLPLIWLLAGLFFLSVIAAFPPRNTHLVSAIPVLALISGVGLSALTETLTESMPSRWRRLQPVIQSILVGIASIAIVYSGCQNYFVTMPAVHKASFEDIASWMAWKTEPPVNLIYLGEENKPRRVQYLVNAKMVDHNYRSLTYKEFSPKEHLSNQPTILFIDNNQKEIRSSLRNLPGFSVPIPYTYTDGSIIGYVITNTAIDIDPKVDREKGWRSLTGTPVGWILMTLLLLSTVCGVTILKTRQQIIDSKSASSVKITSMKAVLFHQHGGPEVLEYADFPMPEPKPGEALIRLRAASVNRMDVFVRNGWHGLKLEMPHINGADGAGEVVSISPPLLSGEGDPKDRVRSGLRSDDHILINPNLGCGQCEYCLAGKDNLCADWHLLGETVRGTYAEYVSIPVRQLYKLPDDFDFHQAAASALVYQTAWHSLVKRGNLKQGETVLIVGAGGGVNTASVQIAKYIGAQVVIVGSDAQKLERAQSIGADILIDRSKEADWSKSVFLATNKRGVDVVVDNVGTTFMMSLRALRKGGRLLTVGNSGGPKFEIDNRFIFAKHLSIIGSTMSTMEDFNEVMGLIVAGKLKPVMDKVFPLKDAAAAQERLWKNENFGKITLDIP
jgi:NADPH:quinone reductase-like Zn-dependent oxidoreductase/4-amino-4-deoxy-L-arabinose transferase-like glycosyltransferase